MRDDFLQQLALACEVIGEHALAHADPLGDRAKGCGSETALVEHVIAAFTICSRRACSMNDCCPVVALVITAHAPRLPPHLAHLYLFS